MHLSFWEKELVQEKFDVTILGAGITGTSTAISIKEKRPDLRVCVIDRATVSAGASTKNAGFACFGSPTEILEDLQKMGEEKTARVIQMRWKGLQILLNRVLPSDMGYKNKGGYEIYEKNDESLEQVVDHLDRLNVFLQETIGLEQVFNLQVQKKFTGFHQNQIFNPYEGSLNPACMMRSLQNIARQKGVVFKSNLQIDDIRLSEEKLITGCGLHIPFHVLVLCTNGFTRQFFPDWPVFAARNQVLITKPVPNLSIDGCYHFNRGYYYFRNVGDRLLLGGARNEDPENELTELFGTSSVIREKLAFFLARLLPESQPVIEDWWSGILGIGEEKTPLIQWSGDRVLAGVRLGGMGVAIGSFLGEKLAEEVRIRFERTR